MVLGLIRERRRAAAAGRPDLIDHLMALRDEQGGEPLNEREIRDEAVTLLLAGHETTAQALTWTWHLLSRHPQAGERMRAELHRVLGSRPVTAADAASLPYTGAVFREALRLYPPVWAVARIAVRDVDLGIVRVREGGTVIASQWVVQRSPRHWREARASCPSGGWTTRRPTPARTSPSAAGRGSASASGSRCSRDCWSSRRSRGAGTSRRLRESRGWMPGSRCGPTADCPPPSVRAN
jgi:hypothetical protein